MQLQYNQVNTLTGDYSTTFTYTIEDADGAQAVGTVTLNIVRDDRRC